MILAPHALAGAATAVILRKHPFVAVVAAFASHFVLDAIPHWHYELDSINPVRNSHRVSKSPHEFLKATTRAAEQKSIISNGIKKDSSYSFGTVFIPGKLLAKDVFKTGADFGAGLAITLGISGMLFPNHFWLTFLGAAAGALPDFLQVMYYLFPNSPLFYFQWFHTTVHAKKDLDEKFLFGISCQVAFSLAVIFVTVFARPFF